MNRLRAAQPMHMPIGPCCVGAAPMEKMLRCFMLCTCIGLVNARLLTAGSITMDSQSSWIHGISSVINEEYVGRTWADLRNIVSMECLRSCIWKPCPHSVHVEQAFWLHVRHSVILILSDRTAMLLYHTLEYCSLPPNNERRDILAPRCCRFAVQP